MARSMPGADAKAVLESAIGGVVAAWIFGGTARGTAGPGSDVDVGVLLEEPAPKTLQGPLMILESALEASLRRPLQGLGDPDAFVARFRGQR